MTKAELTIRLARAEGQVTGVRRMIENKEPVPKIIPQIRAARNALDAVGRDLVLELAPLDRPELREAIVQLRLG